MKSRSIGGEAAEAAAAAAVLAFVAAVEAAVVLADVALRADAVAEAAAGGALAAGVVGVASSCPGGAGGGASSSSSKEREVLSARSGCATGGDMVAGAADGATGSVSKSSRESCSNGSSTRDGGANAAASVSAPADAAATRATRAAIAPVFPVVEVDVGEADASSVGKPNRSAASSRLSSEAAGGVSAAGAGFDQRPELDAALALGDCAADADDVVGVDGEVEVAGAADAVAGAEVATAGDAGTYADALDDELVGAAGRGGGFAAGGGAAAGAGRAGGTVGIASFEIGLVVAEGRAAVLDAVGGGGRLAVVALVACAADVDDGVPADEVPADNAPDKVGLEPAADRAGDVALVVDVGAEPSWRVPDGADVRPADAAADELVPGLATAWAVAPPAAGPAVEFAVAAEPVAVEPVAGVELVPEFAGDWVDAVVLAANLLVAAAPALVEARD
jgi:hypothetical protein